MILAAQLLLTLGVLAFILTPLILSRGERSWAEPELEATRRSIAERKARLYGQLLDLDFDRDSGKISTEDHTRIREEIMAEVLQVLAEEEKVVPQGQRRPVVLEGGDRVERMIEDYKRARRPGAGAAR
ncbi:MAG TPA: c-type cytochrome biogenesis protein CcmI [Candidatus Eisenbacteria bacterium]|nr:c-type cytochrome biogenesis protein CcmI [Candidatus Eisenbacteria bacterium]